MRPRLAPWSSQLSDSIIRVPRWISLPPRRRGQAAGCPHPRTLVHGGVRHLCTHDTTAHSPCSRQRRGWGVALTVGVLLTWLVSVPGPIAAPDTPPPPEAAATTAAITPQVTIEQATFGPTPLTISVGTTVTWANHDGDLHSVASAQGLFASPGLDPGDTFSYRFTTPGTYTYFCALHPHMKGTIVVQ